MTVIPTSQNNSSYVEFAPIIAGAVLACAISVVLVQFGTAAGLSSAKLAYYQGEDLKWRVIAAGIWVLMVQVVSSMTGGYVAGRLRQPVAGTSAHEVEMRDGMHGVLVWALGTLLVVIAVSAGSFMTALVTDPSQTVNTATDLSRRATVILGFITAAASLTSAIAAWFSATLGGDHRDKAIDLSHVFSFRKR